jgi:hypothetical protein
VQRALVGILPVLFLATAVSAADGPPFVIPMAGDGDAPNPAANPDQPTYVIPMAGDGDAPNPAANPDQPTYIIPMAGDGDAPNPVADAAGHCAADETAWFNATVTLSTEVVSICGSNGLDGDDAWLDYRYGNLGGVELKWPQQTQGSSQAFVFRRYTRARETYLKLHFAAGGYDYSILEDFNADAEPQSSASLRVTRLSDGRVVMLQDLSMITPALSLMGLEDKVPTKPFDE